MARQNIHRRLIAGATAAFIAFGAALVASAWTPPAVAPPENSAVVTAKDCDSAAVVVDPFVGVNFGAAPLDCDLDRVRISGGNILHDEPVRLRVMGGNGLCPQCPSGDPFPLNYLPQGAGYAGVKAYVAGNYAYTLYKGASPGNATYLRIIDITSSSTPIVVRDPYYNPEISLPANPTSIFVSGRYAYVTFAGGGSNAFRILDISNPQEPRPVPGTALDLPPNLTNVFVAGRYAYVTAEGSFPSWKVFIIIDVLNPADPRERGSVAQSPIARGRGLFRFLAQVGGVPKFTDVVVSGRYAYAVGGTNFEIFDVANPSVPASVGRVTLGASATDLAVSRSPGSGNRFAYVTTDVATLEFVDITNPAAPARITVGGAPVPLTGPATSIAAAGRYAFAGVGASDVHVVIVDLAARREIGAATVGAAVSDIALQGPYAYVVGQVSGSSPTRFRIVDVSGIRGVSGQFGALTTDLFGIFANVTVGGAVSVDGSLIVAGNAFFNGNVIVNGNLDVPGRITVVTKSFLIDHPLDPKRKFLRHSSVESPEMKTMYDGIVRLDARGEATVELPAYFEALNRDYRYQLSGISEPMPNLHVKAGIADNRFAIGGGVPFGEVNWQVTGIRDDAYARANPMIVEEKK